MGMPYLPEDEVKTSLHAQPVIPDNTRHLIIDSFAGFGEPHDPPLVVIPPQIQHLTISGAWMPSSICTLQSGSVTRLTLDPRMAWLVHILIPKFPALNHLILGNDWQHLGQNQHAVEWLEQHRPANLLVS